MGIVLCVVVSNLFVVRDDEIGVVNGGEELSCVIGKRVVRLFFRRKQDRRWLLPLSLWWSILSLQMTCFCQTWYEPDEWWWQVSGYMVLEDDYRWLFEQLELESSLTWTDWGESSVQLRSIYIRIIDSQTEPFEQNQCEAQSCGEK